MLTLSQSFPYSIDSYSYYSKELFFLKGAFLFSTLDAFQFTIHRSKVLGIFLFGHDDCKPSLHYPNGDLPIIICRRLLQRNRTKNAFKKAIKIISIIIIPAIIVIFLFRNYILLAFGKEYSYEGFILLKFLSISGIFISINSIGVAILNIKCITFN